MADPLDVDARLAEGRPAVDTIGDYVWACHLLGYQNPDLTLHPAQVRDWYGTEDGLNLRALEADRAALESVVAAAENARQLQERQLDVLADAWQGRGGVASREFLLRHGQASAAAASAVRNAVDVLETLRDGLWRAVDDKVAAAVDIDDRRQAERAQWQAAAKTVTTGTGDRAVASELVDQQVKPFVDNDIGSDWLTAMQKAMTAVAAAFDVATEALTGESPARFEVPGDLGPPPSPSSSPPPPSGAVPAESAGTAPAGWSSPAPSAPPATSIATPTSPAAPEPSAVPPVPAPTPLTTPTAAPPSMPAMPSLGEMGGGLPGGAGGLAGLGPQIADAIGGLLSNPDDALPEPELEDPIVDDDEPNPDDDKPTLDDDESPDDEPEDADEAVETGTPAEEPVEDCPQDEPEAPPEPVPTPPPAPPPPPPTAEPPPDAEQLGAETPCEIAADELPQAGP
ncbi:hypothetical protein [Mycolicibacterium sp. 120270]|uniref:hypothetical protein n=1 Tax=Mycolicibacterium sp. 120270 TaxID=3090600 RepID=UPI00299E0C9C|nr:hypothetical protein [Mycolicibacterium sp. 120270]MDX1884491.1 hypothetical protein [Mycolicibacterium sp. 120270]